MAKVASDASTSDRVGLKYAVVARTANLVRLTPVSAHISRSIVRTFAPRKQAHIVHAKSLEMIYFPLETLSIPPQTVGTQVGRVPHADAHKAIWLAPSPQLALERAHVRVPSRGVRRSIGKRAGRRWRGGWWKDHRRKINPSLRSRCNWPRFDDGSSVVPLCLPCNRREDFKAHRLVLRAEVRVGSK